MPRWACSVAAAAAWPVAMTIGAILISPPVLALYHEGLLGSSPVAPMTLISVAVLALSILLSASVYAITHAYCDHYEALEANAEAAAEVRG